MKTRILNREFRHPADGWYQIEAKGYHPVGDGRKIIQVIDDKAVASIVNRFNADAQGEAFRNGGEMLIDREHFKHDPEKDTVAYGWGRQAEARADGPYLTIDWTGTGKKAVDTGDYRFFSTEYDPAQAEPVPDAEIPAEVRNKYPGYKFMRPLRLDGLTLTNMNNNRGQRPITNREQLLPDDPANSPAGGQADTKKKNIMKLIAQKLGLSADASEESILGAIAKIENRATTAEQALKPVSDERDTFKNRLETFLGEQADEDLKAHGITDPKEIAEIKPMLLTNRAGTLLLLAPRKVEKKEVAKPVFNRGNAKTPESNGLTNENTVDPKAEAKAARISNRARELRSKTPTLSLQASYDAAAREIADEETAKG